MIGGSAGVNHGCGCGIAMMRSLIDMGEHFRLMVDSPYPEQQGEAPTEPRTLVLVHRCRMGVADRASRNGDRPAPAAPARDRRPGSASILPAPCAPTPRRHQASVKRHPPPRARSTIVIPSDGCLPRVITAFETCHTICDDHEIMPQQMWANRVRIPQFFSTGVRLAANNTLLR